MKTVDNNPLEILERLLKGKTASEKETRSTELLKAPDSGTPDSWYMYVPACFNEALDIKMTDRVVDGKKERVWTQGSTFAFKQGDTLYNSPDGYKEWGAALKKISLSVQVQRAISGFVTIELFTPNEDKSKVESRGTYTLTQAEFVRFLISGPTTEMKASL